MLEKIKLPVNQIESYLQDAQTILKAKNIEELASVLESSQSDMNQVYEGGLSQIKSDLKAAGKKTSFDEVQYSLLSDYIGFNLQTIIFEEFFPSIEDTTYTVEHIPNLLTGGEPGDENMQKVRFMKFIGLCGKSMVSVSNFAAATEITPMDSFIADLNEATIIGHSWNSPLISVFPPKDSAFFTKLYSTKDWKKKFHQRCINVVNEMLTNIQQ